MLRQSLDLRMFAKNSRRMELARVRRITRAPARAVTSISLDQRP
jgi:hypothetical protein